MLVFSKELFLNDKLTGNKVIDDLILNFDWLEQCDGKEVKAVKIRKHRRAEGQVYKYVFKHSYIGKTNNARVELNKNWIIEGV